MKGNNGALNMMNKITFEEFKQEVKLWMENHPKEYDKFVDEINHRSPMGMMRINKLVCKMAPQLIEQLAAKRHGDIVPSESDLVNLTIDDNLAEQLLSGFYQTSRKNIVPAMLAWLYYGKCFETMVEKIDMAMADSKPGFVSKTIIGIKALFGKPTHLQADIFDKFMADVAKRYVIASSIGVGLRSKDDWANYRSRKEDINSGNSTGIVLEHMAQEYTSVQQSEKQAQDIVKEIPTKLEDFLLDNDKNAIIKVIEKHLTVNHSGPDVARLYYALIEDKHITTECNATKYHKALELSFPTLKFRTERNTQISIKKLNELINGRYARQIGEDKIAIDNWKMWIANSDKPEENLSVTQNSK